MTWRSAPAGKISAIEVSSSPVKQSGSNNLELSRKFVLVSDLRRGQLATLGVHVLTATIFREPMTKVDARLSAARAFSFSELDDLAKRAGWKDFGHRSFKFARQAVWLE